MRSDDAPTTPTAAKPWDGGPLAVPSFLHGQPVLSAVRVPTGKGEVAHVWVVIVMDTSQEHDVLSVFEVHLIGSKWVRKDGDYNIIDFGDAHELMLSRANVAAAMRRAGWRD